MISINKLIIDSNYLQYNPLYSTIVVHQRTAFQLSSVQNTKRRPSILVGSERMSQFMDYDNPYNG